MLKDVYPKFLKIFRTPEFQNYILTKPAGKDLGEVFLDKARNITRGVEFRSNPVGQGNVGSSNLWSWISITHWAMSAGFTNYLSGVPHEFIHHLGYGHEYDYAYGGGYTAHDMYNAKKYDYKVIDLEQKKLYNGPEKSKWSHKNRYVVLHYANFTDFKYIISNRNWSTDAINSNRKLDFSRNKGYNLQISTLTPQNVSIWIDFNDDAEYSDSERVLVNGYCKGALLSTKLTFTIPSNAKAGKHYMRINSSLYTSNPTAYGLNAYGSSFDFTDVNIVDN